MQAEVAASIVQAVVAVLVVVVVQADNTLLAATPVTGQPCQPSMEKQRLH